MKISLKGSDYSKNKSQLKKILKKHHLSWKGSISNPFWSSEEESLHAEFIRENDITIEAILILSTRENSEFLTDFLLWIEPLTHRQIEEKIDLTIFDIVHKPVRKPNKPEHYYQFELKKYQKMREEKIKLLSNP